MKVAVELEGLSRAEWLEARREGIGSSDAPAICGVDRFASPFSVWADKRRLLEEQPDNPAMEWGRLLEEPIAQKYQSDTGLTVTKPSAMYRHDEHEFMLCSPDRELFHPDGTRLGLLEIKTSVLRDDWRDGVPDRTIVQVNHQMAVTGDPFADVACLVLPTRSYEVYRVERDEELIASIVAIETDFWQRVLDGEPPPTDGHRSTTEALHELFAQADVGAVVELPDEARRLLVELDLAKRMKRDAEGDVDELSNAVKAMLGTHEIGMIDDEVAVTWKQTKPRERAHGCSDCTHEPGTPPRQFLPKRVSA